VLGIGRIARKVAPMIHSADGCEVVAVASRDIDRARAFADEFGYTRACTWDDLARNDYDGVDAVYLAATTETHGVWTEKLLRAGRHVLCEKPLAWTRADAERVFRAAEESGKLLVEAFMTLHAPTTREAIAIARDPDGPIGRLTHLEGSFDISICTEPPCTSTRFSHKLGGGSMLDLGCYPLGWMRALTGEEPTIEHASAEMVDWFGATPDGDAVDGSMKVSGSFPSGVTFRFTCSMTEYKPIYLRMVGTKGVAEIPRFVTPTSVDIHGLDFAGAPPGAVERPPQEPYYTDQAAAFARAVRGEEDPLPSAAWSIGQADAIERIFALAGVEPVAAF